MEIEKENEDDDDNGHKDLAHNGGRRMIMEVVAIARVQ